LLIVKLGTILANNQLDALFKCIYLFISPLYKFRAAQCSSSGDRIVLIHNLVHISLCKWLLGMPVWPAYQAGINTYQMMYQYNRSQEPKYCYPTYYEFVTFRPKPSVGRTRIQQKRRKKVCNVYILSLV
jgi:hypothetical protein